MERVAAAVAVAALAVVLLFTVIDREAPYKVVAKPLEGRIHFGKDEDAVAAPTPAVHQAQPATETQSAAVTEGH